MQSLPHKSVRHFGSDITSRDHESRNYKHVSEKATGKVWLLRLDSTKKGRADTIVQSYHGL